MNFITSDSALITLYNTSTHVAINLKDFGWVIYLDGLYHGIYTKDTVSRMVESGGKGAFYDSKILDVARVFLAPGISLNCDSIPTCLDATILSEVSGLIMLEGNDYLNPNPVLPTGRSTSCTGINHHRAALAVLMKQTECVAGTFAILPCMVAQLMEVLRGLQ